MYLDPQHWYRYLPYASDKAGFVLLAYSLPVARRGRAPLQAPGAAAVPPLGSTLAFQHKHVIIPTHAEHGCVVLFLRSIVFCRLLPSRHLTCRSCPLSLTLSNLVSTSAKLYSNVSLSLRLSDPCCPCSSCLL